MSLTLVAGAASAIGTLTLTDDVTNQVVSATYVNVSVTSDTPATATAVVDADGTIAIAPIAAGSANISGTADTTYTNSLGVVVTDIAKPFSVAVTVTAAPVANATTLSLVFPQ